VRELERAAPRPHEVARHAGSAVTTLADILLGGGLRELFLTHPRVRAAARLLEEPPPA
jgi:hypothetical protein